MRRTPFILPLAVSLLISGAVAAPKVASPPAARRLPAPAHVTPSARQELKTRMGQHAASMQNLVQAVVLLDRPTIRLLADRIADEEIFARTGNIRERQRQAFPPRVFTEQEQLGTAARQLAVAAADGGDDKVLADRFAELTRTCVSCHSAYLHDDLDPRPIEPRPKDGSAQSPRPSPR